MIRHKRVRPPGIFALYVTGYSAFRIFEELLRVDPAHHILGERVNFWLAGALTLIGITWFAYTQRAGSGASARAPKPRHWHGTDREPNLASRVSCDYLGKMSRGAWTSPFVRLGGTRTVTQGDLTPVG